MKEVLGLAWLGQSLSFPSRACFVQGRARQGLFFWGRARDGQGRPGRACFAKARARQGLFCPGKGWGRPRGSQALKSQSPTVEIQRRMSPALHDARGTSQSHADASLTTQQRECRINLPECIFRSQGASYGTDWSMTSGLRGMQQVAKKTWSKQIQQCRVQHKVVLLGLIKNT